MESQKKDDENNGNEIAFFAYTVVFGDSLSKICNEHNLDYNSNKGIILAINGISNPNQIYVGQTILLPLTK